MGLRKWLIEKLGGVTQENFDALSEALDLLNQDEEDFQRRYNQCGLAGAPTAWAMSQSKARGNRAYRDVERTIVNGVPIVIHYTLRIDRPRKKLEKNGLTPELLGRAIADIESQAFQEAFPEFGKPK